MKKHFCAVVVALALVACSEKDGIAFANIENKSLNVEKIIVSNETFTPSPLQDGNASINFSQKDYNGFAGCNRFFGSFSVKDDKIVFADNGGATRMLCPPEVMHFEDALLGNLNGEFTLAKENDSILLRSDKVKIYLK